MLIFVLFIRLLPVSSTSRLSQEGRAPLRVGCLHTQSAAWCRMRDVAQFTRTVRPAARPRKRSSSERQHLCSPRSGYRVQWGFGCALLSPSRIPHPVDHTKIHIKRAHQETVRSAAPPPPACPTLNFTASSPLARSKWWYAGLARQSKPCACGLSSSTGRGYTASGRKGRRARKRLKF